MYISQKIVVIFIIGMALIGGGILFWNNLKHPAPDVDLSPSPDTTLFGGAKPTATPVIDSRQQAESVAQSVLGDQTQSQLSAPSPASQLEGGQPDQLTQSKTKMQPPPTYSTDELKNKKAVIITNKGTIEFQIFDDTPIASSNFIYLSNNHFYDGLTFHRVEPGFVIQGGDPLGNGTGGPGYNIKETNIKGNYDVGVVAWAKAGTDPAGSMGSQFFIMLGNTQLPPDYASFGKVTSGQDVVDKIAVGDVMQSVTIQPLQ